MRGVAVRAPWLTGVLLAALAPLALGEPRAATPVATPSPQQLIVKLRPAAGADGLSAAPARLEALAHRHRLGVEETRHLFAGMHVLRVQARAGTSLAQTLAQLRADPEVEYAEVDRRRQPQASSDDPLFSEQWYEQNTEPAAVDAVSAWNVTTGSPGLVIAVLDTGVRFDHPDLRNDSANRLLPGYNLISSVAVANNGYGRGADASDPGDWISAADLANPAFSGCTIANSSWHGTRVSGVLGAISNNTTGIAGMTWEGWLEPVRVLGKCGGYDSDIIAGMVWAAGNHLDGVPDNPYPARILNMSLAAPGSCPASYQQAIDQLVAQGVLVVVAAGNEGGPVDAPANCIGVAAVAGISETGTKVGYSSLGPEVTLSAPAGDCTGGGLPCPFSIVTTTNSGTTVPASNTYTSLYSDNVGTSFAAPQVAAIAGLMLAVNGNLTSQQLIERLQLGSQPFPASAAATVLACHVPATASDLQTSECSCTAQTCGAGMANARGAVQQALRPIAAIAVPAHVLAGASVELDGSGSAAACNATIASYQWSVAQPASNAPALANATSARVSVVAPAAPASYTLVLTVTDNSGRSDSAAVVVTPDSAVSGAPAAAGGQACLAAVSYTVSPAAVGTGSSPAGSAASGSTGSATNAAGGSGGGGGALDLLTLTLIATSLAARRRYSRRCAASSQER